MKTNTLAPAAKSVTSVFFEAAKNKDDELMQSIFTAALLDIDNAKSIIRYVEERIYLGNFPEFLSEKSTSLLVSICLMNGVSSVITIRHIITHGAITSEMIGEIFKSQVYCKWGDCEFYSALQQVIESDKTPEDVQNILAEKLNYDDIWSMIETNSISLPLLEKILAIEETGYDEFTNAIQAKIAGMKESAK